MWTVHKFGGSSLANADQYQVVTRLLADQQKPETHTAVIVSAMSGVTDDLLDLVARAAVRDDRYLEKLEALKQRHFDTLRAVLPGTNDRKELMSIFDADFCDIIEVLKGVSIARSASE